VFACYLKEGVPAGRKGKRKEKEKCRTQPRVIPPCPREGKKDGGTFARARGGADVTSEREKGKKKEGIYLFRNRREKSRKGRKETNPLCLFVFSLPSHARGGKRQLVQCERTRPARGDKHTGKKRKRRASFSQLTFSFRRGKRGKKGKRSGSFLTNAQQGRIMRSSEKKIKELEAFSSPREEGGEGKGERPLSS